MLQYMIIIAIRAVNVAYFGSSVYGFPQMLQTPFSLMTPIQLPSLHNFRCKKSAASSPFSWVIGFPHQQQ
jgi:hypothetical protein